MPTWKDIETIYTEYQETKSLFKKLFKINSRFMNFIFYFVKDKLPEVPLLPSEEFNLLKAIVEIPERDQNTVSYPLATRLALLCMEGNGTVFLELFRLLSRIHVFNESIFKIIREHDDAISVAKAFLALGYRLNVEGHAPLLLLASNKMTIECCLAHIFFKVQNEKEACFWYKKAIEKQQDIAISDFPDTPFSANILFFLAQSYERDRKDSTYSAKAFECYNKAEQLGHLPALLRLAALYQTDPSEKGKAQAFQTYLAAAELGCPQTYPTLIRLAKRGDSSIRSLLPRNLSIKSELSLEEDDSPTPSP